MGASATLCNMAKQKRRKLNQTAEAHAHRRRREDASLADMNVFDAMRVVYAFDTREGFSVRHQLDRLCRFSALHDLPLYVVRICLAWPPQSKWMTFRGLLLKYSSEANVVCQPLLTEFSGRDYDRLDNQFEVIQAAAVEVPTTSSDQQVVESMSSASSSDLADMLAIDEPIEFRAGAAKAAAVAAYGAKRSADLLLLELAKAASAAILHAVDIARLARKSAADIANQLSNLPAKPRYLPKPVVSSELQPSSFEPIATLCDDVVVEEDAVVVDAVVVDPLSSFGPPTQSGVVYHDFTGFHYFNGCVRCNPDGSLMLGDDGYIITKAEDEIVVNNETSVKLQRRILANIQRLEHERDAAVDDLRIATDDEQLVSDRHARAVSEHANSLAVVAISQACLAAVSCAREAATLVRAADRACDALSAIWIQDLSFSTVPYLNHAEETKCFSGNSDKRAKFWIDFFYLRRVDCWIRKFCTGDLRRSRGDSEFAYPPSANTSSDVITIPGDDFFKTEGPYSDPSDVWDEDWIEIPAEYFKKLYDLSALHTDPDIPPGCFFTLAQVDSISPDEYVRIRANLIHTGHHPEDYILA